MFVSRLKFRSQTGAIAMLDLGAVFKDNGVEYLEHRQIDPARRLHPRPDIDAFLRLHSLVPVNRDIVSAAEHDEIYLDTDVEELAKVASVDDIVDLIRCGVRYDSNTESLCMFA